MLNLFTALVLLFTTTASANECLDIFVIQQQVEESASVPADFTMAQVKEFSGPEGSLNLILKSNFKNVRMGVNMFTHNMAIMADVSKIPILDINKPINGEPNLLLQAKRGDWGAKKMIMRVLLDLQFHLRLYYNDPSIDLLSAASILKIYGVKEAKDLNTAMDVIDQVHKNAVRGGELNATTRIIPGTEFMRAPGLVEAMTASTVSPTGIIHNLRSEQYSANVRDIIAHLHLPPDREQFYFDNLKVFETNDPTATMTNKRAKWTSSLIRLNFFINAYMERFPKEASIPVSQRFSAITFLRFINLTDNFHRVYTLNELRLSENLEAGMMVNEQISLIEKDAFAALLTEYRLNLPNDNFRKAINEIRDRALTLKVDDLTITDLSPQITELQTLQFHLSEVVDKMMNNVENEHIETIAELNLTWAKVITGKSYPIEGRDYDSVVFEKDVTSYLKHEKMWGDRSLAALQKGYVGAHNQSGLRAITEIHKDLRYIKVMGRKLRLIGKLKGRTIHFFAIYTEDKSFDQAWLRNLIENY